MTSVACLICCLRWDCSRMGNPGNKWCAIDSKLWILEVACINDIWGITQWWNSLRLSCTPQTLWELSAWFQAITLPGWSVWIPRIIPMESLTYMVFCAQGPSQRPPWNQTIVIISHDCIEHRSSTMWYTSLFLTIPFYGTGCSTSAVANTIVN